MACFTIYTAELTIGKIASYLYQVVRFLNATVGGPTVAPMLFAKMTALIPKE